MLSARCARLIRPSRTHHLVWCMRAVGHTATSETSSLRAHEFNIYLSESYDRETIAGTILMPMILLGIAQFPTRRNFTRQPNDGAAFVYKCALQKMAALFNFNDDIIVRPAKFYPPCSHYCTQLCDFCGAGLVTGKTNAGHQWPAGPFEPKYVLMNLGGCDINVHAGRPSLGPASLSYMRILTHSFTINCYCASIQPFQFFFFVFFFF